MLKNSEGISLWYYRQKKTADKLILSAVFYGVIWFRAIRHSDKFPFVQDKTD